MEFDITALTKTYIWNTFSKVSQVNALMQRMNCNQKEGNTAGYYTKTTKERLNAILHLHTNGKVRIVQVRGKWIVRDMNTDTEINFYDGMVVFQKPLTLSEIEDRKQLEFSIV